MGKTLTLIIHGTFAADAQWWQLGDPEHETFAGRLDDALSKRGLNDTVWKPALTQEVEYSSFAWSGRNRHSDRKKGARKLSAALNDLATRLGASSSDPLLVHFVAHSHGGNVVLDALDRLKSSVRIGRVVLLGTPLITVRPAFRVARFVFATFLLTFFFLGLLLFLAELGSLLTTGGFIELPPQYGPDGSLVRQGSTTTGVLALLIPALLLYGWLLWLFGNLVDVAWRLVCRLFEPFLRLVGTDPSRLYGPSPRRLRKILDGRPMLAMTTRNDEADVLLKVGSAPAKLYREYVAARFSKVTQVLELILLRPFVLSIAFKATEVLTEVLSLGTSVWRCLLLDHDVAPGRDGPYYPPGLLVRVHLDLQAPVHPTGMFAGVDVSEDPMPVSTRVPTELHVSLSEVTDEITRQIRLRHSAFYENAAVTDRIADFLATGSVDVASEDECKRSSFQPSDSFWELLLLANLGLGTSYWHMVTPEVAGTISLVGAFSVALFGYVFPFAILGVVSGWSRIVRRGFPERPWRIFWISWAVYAMVALVSARGTAMM